MGQGKLITVLDHYTRYLAMVETLNQKLQVTFFYPAVIFILLIFNLLHLNFFLFPAALVEFTRENASPGWIMKLLYFANYEFWPFSLILPLLFFLCMLAFFRPWIKNVVSGKSHVSKFTGIDRLLEWQTTAQAQAVVGLYLQSGFTLEKALRSADELLDQSNGFADAADAVSRGFGIRDAFALSPALKDSGYLEDSGMELSEAMLNAAQGNHRITLGMLESFNRFAGIIVIFIAGFFVLCVTAGFFDTYYSLLVAY
jgi:type II secretory pathway component PulF